MEKKETEEPEKRGEERAALVRLLAGVFAGAGAVKLFMLIPPVADFLARVRKEVLLGEALASPDNLVLAGALAGLALAFLTLPRPEDESSGQEKT